MGAALVLALAGCGDDDGSASRGDRGTTQTSPVDAPKPAGRAPDVAVEYLDALAGGNVTDIGRMVDLAADGSSAELYARYQLALARYEGPQPSTSDVQGDQVEQCDAGVNVAGETETICTMFGAFEVDGTGRLMTFSTDGSPIADRLRAGDPAWVTVDGLTAVVVVSYLTSRGDLFVTVDVSN